MASINITTVVVASWATAGGGGCGAMPFLYINTVLIIIATN